MYPLSINVDPISGTVLDFFPVRFIRVPECHLARDNEMRCQTGMRMRRVVGVSASDKSDDLRQIYIGACDLRSVCPRKDMGEAPRAHLRLVLLAHYLNLPAETRRLLICMNKQYTYYVCDDVGYLSTGRVKEERTKGKG